MKSISIILFITILSSCIKDVDYKLEFEGSKLVVNAIGTADNNLKVYITKTIPPFTQIENQDTLLVKNALVELCENSKLCDTMDYIGNGFYQSHIILTQDNEYFITVKADSVHSVISGKDIVSIPAKIMDAKLNITDTREDTTTSLDLIVNAKFIIQKSIKFPYNSMEIRLYHGNNAIDRFLSLNSHNDFIECDDCFNLLDNPCVKKLENDLIEINSDFTLYSVDFYSDEIDSAKVFLVTFSSLADEICQNGIDLEEYYGNPLPFASNPSVAFSNMEGGYGLFMLSSVDSLTVRIK